MRVLIRPPATVAEVLHVGVVAMAETDSEGYYVVLPHYLYFVRDAHGRESFVTFSEDGKTQLVSRARADIWATLLQVGASREDAAKLSSGF